MASPYVKRMRGGFWSRCWAYGGRSTRAKLAKHPLHQCGNKSTVFAVWEELQLFNCSLAGKAATRVHRVAVVCHFPIAYIMIQLLPC